MNKVLNKSDEVLYVYTVLEQKELPRGESYGAMSKGEMRCRPGDLAIVSRCRNQSRIGTLVRVLRPHSTADYDWDVELLGGSIKGRGIRTGRVAEYRTAAVFDWNLTPLPGQDYSDQEGHPAAVRVGLQTP